MLRSTDNVIVSRNTDGFTFKDIDIYRSSGIGWGGGEGDWKFINVKGIRRPGTSRLAGSGGMQMSNNDGSVLIDGCEFSTTADDLINYKSGGIFMLVRQNAPREVITWRGSAAVGDTLTFYDHTEFYPLASAKVVAVEAVTDAALQAEAHDVVKNINRGRDTGDATLLRLTLDKEIRIAAGNFVENSTSGRMSSFTLRNSYLHDSGVRVMAQGFQHGRFENNLFERISGGLALGVDAWWWGGPVSQDITVSHNRFQDTTFRNGWGTGRAAIKIAAGPGPQDPTKGVAFHGIIISGNTFSATTNAAIILVNAANVTVRDNTINHAYTQGKPAGVIQLRSVDGAQVEGDTITDSPGEGIVTKNSHAVTMRHNTIK